MSRLPRAISLVLLASCAKASSLPPGLDGGGGSGGTASTTTGVGGAGGSSDDGGPGIVDAGACQPFLETYMPACVACLGANCCDVALMCFAVSDCFGYADCEQNCPPRAVDGGNVCLDACAANFPMAEPAFTAMTACLHAKCAGSCPY